jgi:uncharacterized membrane protein
MELEEPIIPTEKDDVYDALFRVGMIWRIVYGVARVIFGLMLLRVVGSSFSDLFYRLMAHELVNDPHDLALRIGRVVVEHQSFTVTYFLTAYLIFWGAIDVVLSISLLKEKLWAFPVSVYLICVFVLYEIFRFTHTRSFILAYIIVFDMVLVWLIRKEYFKQLRIRGQEGTRNFLC